MKDLLEKYNIQAPRYTSYPPATEFTEDYPLDSRNEMILESNTDQPRNISLYFHFPYCPQTCLFCGCNSYLQKSEQQAEEYISSLLKELQSLFSLIDLSRPVTQIHWGGGTPNSMDYQLLGKVMDYVLDKVTLSESAEIAIECNPAYLTKEQIPMLRKMGFNRLSLGIQDFDPAVLQAVNREPSSMPIEQLMELIRQNGFDGVNMDFIYGLPFQTVSSFLQSLEKATTLRPNRLVTFSYAHVPWVKSDQKQLESLSFPDPGQKLEMLLEGMALMNTAGYQMIGMDHYALPEDPLGMASKDKTLHRNFQGYCTRETTGQVYAFGASSISQLSSGYLQNVRHPGKYMEAIENNGEAVTRGYKLSQNQKIIGNTITEIMCNGYLNFYEMATRFGMNQLEYKELINFHPERFADLQMDGLLSASDKEIQLSTTGKLLSRVIAMRLDPMIKGKTKGFSKTI
jgi:oxygen-independent coproporphyrinogen-3 oxidase